MNFALLKAQRYSPSQRVFGRWFPYSILFHWWDMLLLCNCCRFFFKAEPPLLFLYVFVMDLRGGRFFSTTWLWSNSGGGSQPLNKRNPLELRMRNMCFLRVAFEKHFLFLCLFGGCGQGKVFIPNLLGCRKIYSFELKVGQEMAWAMRKRNKMEICTPEN